MVTTFSPPTTAKKKPKQKIPVLPASLGAAVLVLLFAWVSTNSKLGKERSAKTQLTDAVVATANALGLASVTADSLADVTNGPILLASVSTAAVERVSELAAARAEAEQVKANVTRLESEGASAQEQLGTLRSQVDAARAEAKTKVDAAAAAQKKSDEEVSRLKAQVKDLQVRLEEALVSSAPPLEEATEPEAEAVVEEAAPAEPAPVAESDAAFVVEEGKSDLFKSIRYVGANKELVVLTRNDQVVVHKNVEKEVYDQFVAAPQLDIFYRFRVMDNYESKPKMREIIHTIE